MVSNHFLKNTNAKCFFFGFHVKIKREMDNRDIKRILPLEDLFKCLYQVYGSSPYPGILFFSLRWAVRYNNTVVEVLLYQCSGSIRHQSTLKCRNPSCFQVPLTDPRGLNFWRSDHKVHPSAVERSLLLSPWKDLKATMILTLQGPKLIGCNATTL